MSDLTTETSGCKEVRPEAFAMNLARAMESSGQALAAFSNRARWRAQDKPPSEIGE